MRRPLFTFLTAIFLVAPLANAENRYIRSDASGNGSGTDWVNAYSALPATLVRGDVYYIADGVYGSYTFDDVESGDKVITIKKATQSDHGTTTGWQTTYGDGQAVFSGQLHFNSDYWILDGNQEPDTYGIRLNFTSSRGVDLDNTSKVTIRNLHVDGGAANANRGFYINSASDIIVSKCQVSNMGNDAFFIGDSRQITLEHIWVHSRNTIDSTHADLIENQNTNENITIRFSRFDFNGQNIFLGGVGAASYSNYLIHGNIFFSSHGPRSSSSVKALTDHSNATGGPIFFFNNTVHQLFGAHDIKLAFSGEAKNNIYYDLFTDNVSFWSSHSHNYFDSAIGNKDGVTGQTGENPWVSIGNSLNDYRLLGPTLAGVVLSPNIGTDPTGQSRGIDGTWDRGAYEYTGPLPFAPSPPTGLSLK